MLNINEIAPLALIQVNEQESQFILNTIHQLQSEMDQSIIATWELKNDLPTMMWDSGSLREDGVLSEEESTQMHFDKNAFLKENNLYVFKK